MALQCAAGSDKFKLQAGMKPFWLSFSELGRNDPRGCIDESATRASFA